MHHINVNSNWGIFLHAFTYSTNFLIFCITIVIASVLCVWLYEKPLFYKLIFKTNAIEHSNSASASGSEHQFLAEQVSSVMPKRLTELSTNKLDYEKIPDST